MTRGTVTDQWFTLSWVVALLFSRGPLQAEGSST
jgi:hypothetical protein